MYTCVLPLSGFGGRSGWFGWFCCGNISAAEGGDPKPVALWPPQKEPHWRANQRGAAVTL